MAGTRGNANALKHGRRSSGSVMAVRLELAAWPGKLKSVERSVNEFRRLLETAVGDTHGAISLYHAALIQTACRHETHARMAARWLRLGADKGVDTLDPAARLAHSKAIADASAARDKTLDRLGLGAASADLFDTLYSQAAIDVAVSDPDEAQKGVDDGQAEQDSRTDDRPDGHD